MSNLPTRTRTAALLACLSISITFVLVPGVSALGIVDAYVTGQTASSSDPTGIQMQPTRSGFTNAFFSKVADVTTPTPTAAPTPTPTVAPATTLDTPVPASPGD